MSPRIRLPKRNKFFTLRKPPRLEQTVVLVTAAVLATAYYAAVAAAAVQIYRNNKETGLTRLMEKIFPYPASAADGEVIYLSRFREEVDSRATYDQLHNKAVDRKAIGTYVTEQLTNRTLYVHELQRRGIEITEAQVEQQYNEVLKDAGGEEKLTEFLHKQYGPNVTLNQFRLWIRESLYEAVLKQKVLAHVQVSHILIALPQDSTQDKVDIARARAVDVRSKIATPEQFSTVAKEYSDDVATRDAGGALGETGKDGVAEQFSPEFETAIFTQKVNEISQPIRTHYGWHLVMVTKHEGLVDQSLAEFTQNLRKQAKSAVFIGK